VSTGTDNWYGLGLEFTVENGTPVPLMAAAFVVCSDAFLLPERRVGAMILMNSKRGKVLMHALRRKLLQSLFNPEPKARTSVFVQAATVSGWRQQIGRTRLSQRTRKQPPILFPFATVSCWAN
jgi:hypothetical protein